MSRREATSFPGLTFHRMLTIIRNGDLSNVVRTHFLLPMAVPRNPITVVIVTVMKSYSLLNKICL